jgi:quercetin dioxygenase-like cupin family protein
MTMSTLKSKRMFGLTLVVCTFAGIAVRLAWATPGSGISTTIISGPVTLDEIHLNSHSDTHDVKIKTNGLSDIYVVYNKLAPGGHTGWHSHPGPSIISVKSGQATEYRGDDPGTPIVHSSSTSFVDDGQHVHMIVNEGTTDLELIAFQILPFGATRRIDQPAP